MQNTASLAQKTDQMHVIQALHGKICAVAITDRCANDSPVPRDLPQFPPQGSGSDVLWADAAHANKMNCAAVAKTESPMMPSQTASPRFGAYADMLRFCDEHPGTFYGKLAKRNIIIIIIKSAFSSIKAGFGCSVCAIKKAARAIEVKGQPRSHCSFSVSLSAVE